MNQLLQSSGSDPGWQELRPVLDEAMHDLSADDREAVLLRFFEQRSLAEIGTRLGLTEDTARKRVARAVDKLRAGLAKRGITSTVAALSVALAERTVSAAPSGLAGQVSRAAVAEAAASGGAHRPFVEAAGRNRGCGNGSRFARPARDFASGPPSRFLHARCCGSATRGQCRRRFRVVQHACQRAGFDRRAIQ